MAVFGSKADGAKETILSLGGKHVSFHQGTFFYHFPLEQSDEEHEISIEGGSFDLVYLDQGKDMLEKGVFPLYGDGNALPGRNRCHFSPLQGWMNDPNGLCVYQGKTHLFYQYNPYGQEWGNMHWGHAVSDDLLHWTHEPVVFFPQLELQDRKELRGGAFSGSAMAFSDHMDLFFTRNIGGSDRSWRKENQVKASSSDGISFLGEHEVLACPIEGCSGDFRDPKVFSWGQGYLMVVGSRVNGKPCVLLFSSKDTEHWEFVSKLYEEHDEKYAIAECPDFFPLDGSWVLVVGFINQDRSPKRDVKYLVGSFDGKTFTSEHEGYLDEGLDFYATQTFERNGKRILFGWNPDSLGIYRKTLLGANGTLSLPRELSLEDGVLVQKPAQEVYALVNGQEPKGAPYYLSLQAKKIGDFSIPLAKGVILLRKEGRFKMLFEKEERCAFQLERLEKLEVFVDTALIEIFANEGKKVATVRYCADGAFAPSSLSMDMVDGEVECLAMEPVWR